MPPAFSTERAVVVSAVVFSAFHLDPVGFFARVQLGLLFGLLLLRTGSLWPGIAAHSANNVVSTILFFAAGGVEAPVETEAEAGLLGVALLSMVGMVSFFAMMRAARRNPALWTGVRPERVAALPGPVPSLLRLVLPWVLAATAALGALVLVDPRGLELQRVDQALPLEPLRPGAPDAEQAERTALRELRARVRRGEAPLKAYREERARLRERARKH
ncbi:MAG TPA: CPBP family glutamic-type intramembrane protease, partial [Aggregicoccus sp.]|nr:CPBP family glutamic-type intramembrane protease [Aggregicoccus sp.]